VNTMNHSGTEGSRQGAKGELLKNRLSRTDCLPVTKPSDKIVVPQVNLEPLQNGNWEYGGGEETVIVLRTRNSTCGISAEPLVANTSRIAEAKHNIGIVFAETHLNAPKLRLGETHVPNVFLPIGEKILPVV
jgi:hypothetical protein